MHRSQSSAAAFLLERQEPQAKQKCQRSYFLYGGRGVRVSGFFECQTAEGLTVNVVRRWRSSMKLGGGDQLFVNVGILFDAGDDPRGRCFTVRARMRF